MKITNRIIVFILVVVFLFTNSISIMAHNQMLDVEYDECGVPRDQYGQIEPIDGEDELWYWLNSGFSEYHVSNEVQTIKYYFANDARGSDTYTWTTDLTDAEALAIKNAYANSMKKWNNIYYYSYDANDNRMANKIIDVVEGTLEDHNLIIYPTHDQSFVAQVSYSDINAPCLEINDKNVGHFHYEHWWMEVNIDSLKEDNSNYEENRKISGAHELGHVLGLRDVDNYCNYSNEYPHHEELLMGYGSTITQHTTYAKYKDIAGVSITRGFHKDSDHKWMLRNNVEDSTQDVICALCNGVRYEVQNEIQHINGVYYYENKEVVLFGSCNGEHIIDNGNMLLVATDTIRDFYKCLCCRYILEVPHSVHSYTEWTKLSSTHHIECCEYCGQIGTQTGLHTVRLSEVVLGIGHCIHCGAKVMLKDDIVQVGPMSITKVTINGSYILPNGIIVLVDEDIEAYENGTLVFYDKDNLPQTQ